MKYTDDFPIDNRDALSFDPYHPHHFYLEGKCFVFFVLCFGYLIYNYTIKRMHLFFLLK